MAKKDTKEFSPMLKLLDFIVNILHCMLGLLLICMIAGVGAVLSFLVISILWVVGLPIFGDDIGAHAVVIFVGVVLLLCGTLGPVYLFCCTDEFRHDSLFLRALGGRFAALFRSTSKYASFAVLGGVVGVILALAGIAYGVSTQLCN